MKDDELVTITLRRSHWNTVKVMLVAFLSMFGGNVASVSMQIVEGGKPKMKQMSESDMHSLCDDHLRVIQVHGPPLPPQHEPEQPKP